MAIPALDTALEQAELLRPTFAALRLQFAVEHGSQPGLWRAEEFSPTVIHPCSEAAQLIPPMRMSAVCVKFTPAGA